MTCSSCVGIQGAVVIGILMPFGIVFELVSCWAISSVGLEEAELGGRNVFRALRTFVFTLSRIVDFV